MAQLVVCLTHDQRVPNFSITKPICIVNQKKSNHTAEFVYMYTVSVSCDSLCQCLIKQDLSQGQDSSPDSALPIT